jgi:hypothetical protein
VWFLRLFTSWDVRPHTLKERKEFRQRTKAIIS